MPTTPKGPPAWLIGGASRSTVPPNVARTAAEYSNLLSGAGFRQTRVIPTAGPAAIVEAIPV